MTAPAQLATLTRLDQDMKQIIDSALPEDQKVLKLDQLLQRYQWVTKQMKNETIVTPTVVLLHQNNRLHQLLLLNLKQKRPKFLEHYLLHL